MASFTDSGTDLGYQLGQELAGRLGSPEIDSAAREQSIEFLDNLGFLNLGKNDKLEVDEGQFSRALAAYRRAVSQSQYAVVQGRAGEKSMPSAADLTEAERQQLETLLDLQGKFVLNLPLAAIADDAIAIRVLNYRLDLLALTPGHQADQYGPPTQEALASLVKLTQVNSVDAAVALTNNFDHLCQHMLSLESFEGSDFCGIAYFGNPGDTRLENRYKNRFRKFSAMASGLQGSNLVDQLGVIRPASKMRSISVPGSVRKIRRPEGLTSPQRYRVAALSRDPINRFFVRQLQLQLFLAGTYAGRLDSDMGPMSLEALDHYAQMENHDQDQNQIDLADYVIKIDQDVWAVNVYALLQQLVEQQSAGQQDSQAAEQTSQSLATQIEQIAGHLPAEQRPQLYQAVDKMVADPVNVQASKRRRLKRGFGLFRRISAFFKKVASAVIRGIRAVISALKSLFQWLKNGVRLLMLEIREAIGRFRRAIGFVFGKRTVTTGAISSRFDFDFDAQTQINAGGDSDITKQTIRDHEQKLRQIKTDVESTAGFLTKAIPLILDLLKPPLGWLAAGLRLVRLLADFAKSNITAVSPLSADGQLAI